MSIYTTIDTLVNIIVMSVRVLYHINEVLHILNSYLYHRIGIATYQNYRARIFGCPSIFLLAIDLTCY